MRRLTPWDRVLFASVLGLFGVCFGLESMRFFGDGLFDLPLHASSAPSQGDFPVIRALPPVDHATRVEARIGDLLLRAGAYDLRGAGRLRAMASVLAAIDSGGRVELRVERAGRELSADIRTPSVARWSNFLGGLGFALAGSLAFLGGGGAAAPRLFFLSCTAIALHMSWFWGGSVAQTLAGMFSYALGGILLGPLSLLTLLHFPEETARSSRATRLWPWLFAIPGVGYASMTFGFPFSSEVGTPLALGGNLTTCAALVAVVIASYRRASAAGRRQLRWVATGVYLGVTPLVGASLAMLWDPALYPMLLLANLMLHAVPICFLIAIVGYNAFDVDRLISATATYSITLLLLLGGVVFLGPPVSARLGDVSGFGAQEAHLALALGLGLAVVPLNRRLRPRIEQIFFPERQALANGIDGLRGELAACGDTHELQTLLGEQLAVLLRPERCLILERAGGTWKACFTSGGPAAAAHDPGAELAALLAERAQPITFEEGQLRAREASAEGRAALRARGIAVALPIQRGDELAAVLLLGPKRSTDVYTPTDLALLESVAERAGVSLLRIRNAELRAESREEHEANLAKSRFLAAASHDLRQPLHALGLFVGALTPRVKEPEAAAIVAKIQRSTDELEDLFNSVLEISKLDAGVVEPRQEDVPLTPLLAQLAEELEPQAARKGLRLHVAPTRAIVRSDPLLLGRILRNLVTNAIRYTERGKILVGTRPRGGALRIEVWDTGPGIPGPKQHEVFREFERLESSSPPGEGLGLGLSIVDRLCRLLGHGLDLRSVPGRGSVFAVTVAHATAKLMGVAPEEPSIASGLRGRVLLVVDDDAAIRDAMHELLESWECRVLTASSGESARRILVSAARAPEAILVDWGLAAGETGLEVIRGIRARLGAEIPAVVITGDTSPERLAKIQASGLALLSKPVSPMRLRALLNRLLG